jgi:DNA end-binding protein Ku
MSRAFWKGVISFGLVAIPVKMSVATETKTISFHLLHKKCLTRPKQVLRCETDKEYFSLKDTVHGYEVTKDQYVVLDESDFKKVPVKTSHSIDILGFVEAKEIDPLYYHSSHYIEPEELGDKPFQLLLKALEKTGRVGIAKVAFSRREHLCSLRPSDDIMILQTMYFQDEIVKREESARSKIKVTEAELDMATSLVKTMAKPFKMSDYKDDYEQALKQIIEAKVKGLKIKEPEEPKIEVTDLMAALRESIKAAKKERQPVLK